MWTSVMTDLPTYALDRTRETKRQLLIARLPTSYKRHGQPYHPDEDGKEGWVMK